MLHAPIEIRLGPGGWSILDAGRFRPTVDGLETLELRPAIRTLGSSITVKGKPYPGAIRLVGRSTADGDSYDVVNHVLMEDYLPGVLARELYNHWHLQTHAAQAVAARSFACSELTYFADRRHYDVTNTEQSQVYAGSDSHSRARQAVDMTRGIVLGYGGLLVPGYYSSCCGGTAADALDVIGEHPFNDVPPLRGRSGKDVCTDASLYSWTIERSDRDLRRRLRAYGEAHGNKALANARSFEAIEVAEENAHGRPRRYRIITGRDEVVGLDAAAARRAIDYSGDGLSAPKKRLWSSNIEVSISRRGVRIEGHGHGHGAGMCQHGAQALANRGKKYPAILRWYYPDIALTQAYA